MTDYRKKLASKYSEAHRFANFGSIIASAKISGFRGIDAEISFDFPITALTGLNGAGKSTFGQLMLCAYKQLATATLSKRYYVKDFFPVSVADPEPFKPDASVTFRFQSDKVGTPQELTVRRTQKEWGGYKRQPERNTEYVGFTVYIPKVERRDLSIYNAKSLTLTSQTQILDAAKWVSRILGSPYEEIYFQGVAANSKSGELGIAKRLNAT